MKVVSRTSRPCRKGTIIKRNIRTIRHIHSVIVRSPDINRKGTIIKLDIFIPSEICWIFPINDTVRKLYRIDFQIASTVAGTLRVTNCVATNARVLIDDSGVTSAEYANNIGFGNYGGLGLRRATKTISSAELKALETTAIEVVPAVTGKYVDISYA